jgi:hypothetical protein
MLNPYIKHGTLLWEFNDHDKTIQGDWFPQIRGKTKHKNMIKKKIIQLMLKDDVKFKGVVAWFENKT